MGRKRVPAPPERISPFKGSMRGCNPTELRKERVTSELSDWTPIRNISDDGVMTKVDEKGYVPEIDDDARRRLAEALDKDGVVAAMLIGSQARGEAGPLSDVDLAVWSQLELDRGQSWDLQLALLGAAQDTLRTNEVDIVMLNDAPPLLQHRSIRDAVMLVERDRAQRIRFETRAILDYLDTAPLRLARKENLKREFREDRFGRR